MIVKDDFLYLRNVDMAWRNMSLSNSEVIGDGGNH